MRKPSGTITIVSSCRNTSLRALLAISLLLALVCPAVASACNLAGCQMQDPSETCSASGTDEATRTSDHCDHQSPSTERLSPSCEPIAGSCCIDADAEATPASATITADSPHPLGALYALSWGSSNEVRHVVRVGRSPDPPRPPLFLLHDALLI